MVVRIKPGQILKHKWVDNFISITCHHKVTIFCSCLFNTKATIVSIKDCSLKTDRKVDKWSAIRVKFTITDVKLALFHHMGEVIRNLLRDVVDNLVMPLGKSVLILLIVQGFFITTDSIRRLCKNKLVYNITKNVETHLKQLKFVEENKRVKYFHYQPLT